MIGKERLSVHKAVKEDLLRMELQQVQGFDYEGGCHGDALILVMGYVARDGRSSGGTGVM